LSGARIPTFAHALLRFASALLAASILVQFFIAGMAALTNPDWWIYHVTWVRIFQWLVLPLPVLAWFCGQPRRLRVVLACIPALQIALQYVFAHRALEGLLPIGLGLHAVNAALMFVVAWILAASRLERKV
jgi:Family of unknown function (DUF6220)